MRIQLTEVETLDQEVCGLLAVAAASAPRDVELKQALNVSPANHGLKATQITMSGGNVQVQPDKVPFGAIAEWLRGVRQAQRTKMIDTNIEYVGTTALVNVMVTLQGLAAPGR